MTKLIIGQPKTLKLIGLPEGSSIHPVWSIVSGTAQLQPSADGKSCVITDDTVGDNIVAAKVGNTAAIIMVQTVDYDIEIVVVL